MARKRQALKLIARISPDPMSAEELRRLERTLARVIARAYLADHPELLNAGRESDGPDDSPVSLFEAGMGQQGSKRRPAARRKKAPPRATPRRDKRDAYRKGRRRAEEAEPDGK